MQNSRRTPIRSRNIVQLSEKALCSDGRRPKGGYCLLPLRDSPANGRYYFSRIEEISNGRLYRWSADHYPWLDCDGVMGIDRAGLGPTVVFEDYGHESRVVSEDDTGLCRYPPQPRPAFGLTESGAGIHSDRLFQMLGKLL
jgi:hypothetical protein